jgi:radical SAM superfamily enzyme YgiQ (UPF0313 family)
MKMSINDSTDIPGKAGSTKILAVLLPFWSPLVPPLGVSCLKAFVGEKGYEVKTVDVNVEEKAARVRSEYFAALKEYIPGNKAGNLQNIGNNVLNNQMMVHINSCDENKYIELVKILVARVLYFDISTGQVLRLKEILDDFYRWLENYFLHLLEGEQPGILAVSAYRGNLAPSLFVLKLTREKYPHIKTVMGGAIFSLELNVGTPDLEYFLERTGSYLDKIFIGEGELLFFKYLEGKLPGSQRVYTLNDIDEQVLDLGTVKVPDFSGLNLSFYPYLAAYTSRSCPFQCKFCSETVYWGKYRKKKARQIVDELIQLYEKHKSQLFLMCDSLLNPIISDLSSEFIDAERVMYWDGYLRVGSDVCNPGNTHLWRRGGFYRARLGIESGSERILESMGKKINVEQIKSAVSSLARAGIKTSTYWVIGYPGETEEDFQQTLDLIEVLRDDIYEADCNPFNYYLTGQVNSQKWGGLNKSVLLFPGEARDMLVIETRVLEGEPSREVTYERLNRFSRHCRRLGIHNPYSLDDIFRADQYWEKMHKNSVPSLLEFLQAREKGTYISECRDIKKVAFGKKLHLDNNGWGF